MYENLFNEKLQNEMVDFFLGHMARFGVVKTFSKNEVVDPYDANNIYIVLDGVFDQILYSRDGDEISFFRLSRGTIFGEMDFFEGYRTCTVTKAIKQSSVSIVSRKAVECQLREQPEIYHHFMHSIIRKYRIVMLELADVKFNDSLGKLAHAILRFWHLTHYRNVELGSSNTIDLAFTHEELANRLASNRSTITSGLNYFKEKGYISIEGKKITIINAEGLKAYINPYWSD